jgi:tetratricopeptide (TPR) repeat protein
MVSNFHTRPGFGPGLQDYLKAAQAAIVAGDAARASQISADAAQRGIEHPGMLALAVYHFLDHGRTAEALRYAERARELAPRQPDALNALGQTLVRLGREREAIEVFDKALKENPASFVTHFNKAKALVEISELKRAREHFLRALEQDSSQVEALTNVAHLAAQRGDAKEAREFANRALKLDPRQIHASFALAVTESMEGKHEAALAILSPVLERKQTGALERGTAFALRGDALDGLGRYPEAFQAYSRASSEFQAGYAPVYAKPGQMTASNLARRLETYFRNSRAWNKAHSGAFKSPVETHVFLVGFPRSGTTLLGQVLAAHPKIQTMEEHNCLGDAHGFVLEEGGLDRLAAMDGEQLDIYRAAYWRRAKERGAEPVRPVFVDKLPLNSALLCLIVKLFPDAKILFALRDPRDVVFSCFRRRFGMNVQMYELLTLESAAAYYDVIMALSDAYREKLALDIHDARHENLVSDFVQETRRLCQFLGVEHDASMEEFAPAARDRHIDTPSAAQVARGLSGEGQGRWRDYRCELSSIDPILAPWISRFGYTDELKLSRSSAN